MPRLAEEWFVVGLLACLFGVFGLGAAFVAGIRRGLVPGGTAGFTRSRVNAARPSGHDNHASDFAGMHCRWLAIRSGETAVADVVLEAFRSSDRDGPDQSRVRWLESANRWHILVGPSLPDPSEDIDRCYRLLRELSVRVGWVQFFSLNRIAGDHAWVVAQGGRIIRAYAWAAGQVLWNQGIQTAAERELGVTCLDYCEVCARSHEATASDPARNVEKVFPLAAAWGVDPLADV